ncbi:CIA30-domain-containing protein [Myriangium duriaei CBS 260.36]|uniref:CIA30-domain-containing protein n=1 Tax=Myriangium duriaei CBS 260.36 TaxID=1168546 RepID=A0A9P4J9B1_9PEZI|nr:CIA30-domain-containing protein [Myriangium duriaei CBS 260.36]
MTKAGSRVIHNLFGGSGSWRSGDWTASDDRVRGGKSESHFESSGEIGRFYGDLDIETLGGAGFASQRTAGDDKTWDLSEYDGIQLDITKGDDKRYTLILKDELLPPNPTNGREQSTTSYEYAFHTKDLDLPTTVQIPWASFQPTYRGREQKDAKPLDKSRIKRLSLMMRSFFGTQKGPFSISLRSISAYSVAGLRDLEACSHNNANTRRWSTPLTLGFVTLLTVAAVHTLYKRWSR